MLSPKEQKALYHQSVSELHEAADAVEAAAAAIRTADEDADTDALQASLTEAEEKFSAVESKTQGLADEVELSERLQAARSIAIPDTEPSSEVKVTGEPLTYERSNSHIRSFFRDLARRDLRHDAEAEERLTRHMTEMEAEGKAGRAAFDLSSTDAAGGYLVAPLYLQEEFVDLARAGRAVTDALGTRPLPPNTDSINIPTLATGVTTADQADNAAVSETDATFGTLAAAVKTIAGMQDVSQQLVDRSVPGVDEVIFADLVKDYNVRLDVAVLTSSAASNEGILEADGVGAVTYTDASPTVGELYPKIADAIQRVHTGVYLPPNAVFMHPRRWAFLLSGVDTANRPLITPYAPQNAAGAQGGVVSEGLVGSIQGLPVYVDANIPTNLGAGTNEDRIIVCRRDELFVWEDQSGPYLETFRDVGSGTLTVRFRLHNYWAQQHERRPAAISVLAGTGLVTPAF